MTSCIRVGLPLTVALLVLSGCGLRMGYRGSYADAA